MACQKPVWYLQQPLSSFTTLELVDQLVNLYQILQQKLSALMIREVSRKVKKSNSTSCPKIIFQFVLVTVGTQWVDEARETANGYPFFENLITIWEVFARHLIYPIAKVAYKSSSEITKHIKRTWFLRNRDPEKWFYYLAIQLFCFSFFFNVKKDFQDT